jgi:hypothetical protein
VNARSETDPARLALVAFGLVVLAALLWAGSTSSAAADPYNPSADGTSELRQQLTDADRSYEAVGGYDGLEPEGTAALVVAAGAADETEDEPARGVTTAGAESFVHDGGTLLVLADDPDANELLETVGADARIDDAFVRDDRHRYRGPATPVATEIADHELTEGVDGLGLTNARAVEPNGATVLASTSSSGFLVDRPDATPEEDDEPATHPVATAEAVGSGTVVVVGDSALATNRAKAREDNGRLLANGAADADRVVLISPGAEEPPLSGLQTAVLDRIDIAG